MNFENTVFFNNLTKPEGDAQNEDILFQVEQSFQNLQASQLKMRKDLSQAQRDLKVAKSTPKLDLQKIVDLTKRVLGLTQGLDVLNELEGELFSEK